MEQKSAGPSGELVSAPPAANSEGDINAYGERLQKLLVEVEALPYPGARELIQDCMESVLGFYGAGLKRILEVVSEGGFLSCALNHRYDVVHAGRCAEIPSAHLDPLPLLVQENVVKVALTKEVVDAPPEIVQQNT
jgi:hypothetical protein